MAVQLTQDISLIYRWLVREKDTRYALSAGLAKTGFYHWFQPVLTGWQKPLVAKTRKNSNDQTVGFLVSNNLKCTNVYLDVIGSYCALCLTGFLVGDCLECPYMVFIAIGMHASLPVNFYTGCPEKKLAQ